MNAYEGLSIDQRFALSKQAREIYKKYIGPIPEGMDVDHIDHNPFNNDPLNLRAVTRSENLRNRRKFTMNKTTKTSTYKGVYWCRKREKWIAQMRYNKKTYYIGQFKDEEAAFLAWFEFRRDFNFLD